MNNTESLTQSTDADAAAYTSFLDAWRGLLAQNDAERLFALWQAVRALTAGWSNDDMATLARLQYDIEDRILATPTSTLRELHIKIAVCDGDGDMDMTPCQRELAKQAWAALEADRTMVN